MRYEEHFLFNLNDDPIVYAYGRVIMRSLTTDAEPSAH